MRGARRGTLSQREKVAGRAFDRQIGSTKRGDRYADCRIRTEFDFDRDYCYTTESGHLETLGLCEFLYDTGANYWTVGDAICQRA